MASRQGLGPLGRAAVQRAAAVPSTARRPHELRQPQSDIETGNPAVTSTYSPGAEEDPATLNWLPFVSSRIVEAAYVSRDNRLFVRFVKPEPEGTYYTYDGVTPQEWRNFRRSASPGKYVNRILNGKNYHPGLGT